MNHLVHKLTLDMHSSISQASLSVKKGDTKRKLYITLTENGKVYTINEGCTAVFSATKYNNDTLFNACTIEDGVVVYEFTELTANIPGKMDCEIKLYGADNGLITSPQFSIIVEGVVNKDSDVMASDEYSALTSAITYVDSLKRDLDGLINNFPTVDDTLSVDSKNPVQNKVITDNLYGLVSSVESLTTGLSQKQNTLVSGTNIKTINGQSLLDSGDITINTDITVDTDLDLNSTNPVENKAVARQIGSLGNSQYQMGERLTAIEADIADLKYVEIKISSISNNVGTVEMGSTINSVTITWGLNKDAVSQTVDGKSVDASARSHTLSGLALTSGKTYTVTATDERDATATANTSVVFYNGVYYGVMADGATVNSAAILALTRKLQSGKGLTFTANAGDGQNIVYALPTRYGTPNFNVGGFDGGFSKTATISLTNASGYTENYDVWVSDNTGLGNTTVKVS